MISPALRRALVGELGQFRVKSARAFGLRRDRKILALLSKPGPRRARAAALARWSVEQVFPLTDDDLAEEYEDMLRLVSRAAAWRVESQYSGPVANEAQFVGASSAAIKMVAIALALYMAFVTEKDERVCRRCQRAEAGGPYLAQDAPEPPIHLHCRCVVVPA